MKAKVEWRLGTDADLEKAHDFFYTMRNETNPPFSDYPHGLKRTIEFFLSNGRLVLAVIADNIVGLIGYFHGVPVLNANGLFDYTNPEIAYIYSCVIDPGYRGILSYEMVFFVAKQIIADGHNEIRFKAYKENNDRINLLYSRYGKVIREEKNTQGYLCNLYTADPYNWVKRKVPTR